jgi:hypothetical protein
MAQSVLGLRNRFCRSASITRGEEVPGANE